MFNCQQAYRVTDEWSYFTYLQRRRKQFHSKELMGMRGRCGQYPGWSLGLCLQKFNNEIFTFQISCQTTLSVAVVSYSGGSNGACLPPPKKTSHEFSVFQKNRLKDKLVDSSGCDNAKRRSASGGLRPQIPSSGALSPGPRCRGLCSQTLRAHHVAPQTGPRSARGVIVCIVVSNSADNWGLDLIIDTPD